MFDDFGCFIINDKSGSLKFYNGPSFANQYAKAQFSSTNNMLLGVDFKQQTTIPMKVGLYWFTIEEYQKFLDCINPFHINYLTFDFNDKYGYLVKSGKIADSPRYIIGKDQDGQNRYYTELDLSWEIVGDPCVRSNLAYEYDATKGSNNCEWSIARYPSSYADVSKRGQLKGDMGDTSLLDTPFVFEIPCRITSQNASLKLEAILPPKTVESVTLDEKTIEMFEVQLQNLVVSETSVTTGSFSSDWMSDTPLYQLYLRYDSETGLIYIQNGSQNSWHLLNYQTDNYSGLPLLKSAEIFKYKIPGQFSLPDRDTIEWKFKLTYSGIDLDAIDENQLNQAITMYSRKNIV